MRKANVKRKTEETSITVTLHIDGMGNCHAKTGIGFFDHMIESIARHGLFNLKVAAKGDLHVDQHHTIEDTGLCLGQAFDQALGARKGIERTGCFLFPMDEALAYCAIDISGRPFFHMRCPFKSRLLGDLECACLEDFFQGFASALKASIHIKVVSGRSDHHKAEAIFKAFAKALQQACARTDRARTKVPSTKGKL